MQFRALPEGYKTGNTLPKSHAVYGWNDKAGRTHIVTTGPESQVMGPSGGVRALEFWADELRELLGRKPFDRYTFAPDPLLTLARIASLAQKAIVPREWIRALLDHRRQAA